jgi:molybdopterin biosynthesis enzyme
MAIVRLPKTLTPEQRRSLTAALARVLARQILADWRQAPVENGERKAA